MNSNELSEIIQHLENAKYVGASKAATMLRQQQAEIAALKAAVCSFFNDYLDQREESDSGRVFAPIYISNCRCMTLDPMSKLMNEMRELSGAKPPPKRET